MAEEVALLKGYGILFIFSHIVANQKYLLYPPKSSSPPSPERLTVTYVRVSFETRYVGI